MFNFEYFYFSSIHLWDLTEKPTLQKSTKQKESTDFVDTDSSRFTEIERDREWNLKNSHVGYYQVFNGFQFYIVQYVNK